LLVPGVENPKYATGLTFNMNPQYIYRKDIRISHFEHFFTPGIWEPLSSKYVSACHSFLVLEDLTSAEFIMRDSRQGLDLSHCLLVMQPQLSCINIGQNP